MFGHRLPISRRVRANFAISGRKIRPFIREPPSAGKRDDPHCLPRRLLMRRISAPRSLPTSASAAASTSEVDLCFPTPGFFNTR